MATIALDATYTVDPQPSGVAVYCRRLIESLSEIECEHHYLLCYRLSRIKSRREFLRPDSSAGPRGPRFSVRYYQEPWTFWLPWQTDLFHSLVQRPPAFRFRKEIVTVIDLFPLTGKNYSTPEFQRKFSALLLEAVERAVRVITPSQYTTDQLLKHTSVPREKIRQVPFGVDLPASTLGPESRALERERLVGRGNIMVLTVGVIQTRKNTLNALRAIQRLPERYRLVIAGGNGHGSEPIHDFIRSEGLASRVVALGYVPAEQLPMLYDAANVFLFPSFEEGFGLPVLEAMAHGLPVVTSETSSLPEVGGDAALYVNPHDPDDIARKIMIATEHERQNRMMIERGLKRARTFTWHRTAKGYLQVYNEVLAL
ncbi:MAG TPA: glycosyltransferase family 1 protein [Terriglobia bacterium]|jgi:glycosyltransferase involved in cell wall biosynthesis|nr:glycosyltransferase family 1 protein [Terriglobia bacterium]